MKIFGRFLRWGKSGSVKRPSAEYGMTASALPTSARGRVMFAMIPKTNLHCGSPVSGFWRRADIEIQSPNDNLRIANQGWGNCISTYSPDCSSVGRHDVEGRHFNESSEYEMAEHKARSLRSQVGVAGNTGLCAQSVSSAVGSDDALSRPFDR